MKTCPRCREQYPEDYIYCPRDNNILALEALEAVSSHAPSGNHSGIGRQVTLSRAVMRERLSDSLPAKEHSKSSDGLPGQVLNNDQSIASTLLFYGLAILPAILFGLLLSLCCYRLFTHIFYDDSAAFYIEYPLLQSISNGLTTTPFNPVGRYFFIAGNFFLRVHIAVGAGAALASMLMIPSAKRNFFWKADKIGLVIRANCVATCTNLVMSVFFFLNPFEEKLSWDTAKQGVPIYWTETFVGAAAFFIAQQLFLKTKDVKTPINPKKRGITKSEPGQVYLPEPPKPRSADSAKEGGETNGES